MYELSEVAERILCAKDLRAKLLFSPRIEEIVDSPRRRVCLASRFGRNDIVPGRPSELRLREDGVRPEFPSVNRLDETRQRGVMMHFLCNHELLAVELMALVLLKFPAAPGDFRMGVYATLREEQAHTLMYLRRMRECGLEFGELPVNDYFWRTIAPMKSPMDFVSRLSLTFEQANLDFSFHFAKLFRQVGDVATAVVLEQIYRDEIGHVGHGLKWFRRWKDPRQSDWEAFRQVLVFPLHPIRAKGVAPFNAEGRKLAGLDEDFIKQLKVTQQSRGRTPTVHWFNVNAEAEMAGGESKRSASASQKMVERVGDLSGLAWAMSRRDDVALVDSIPSLSYLEEMCRWGVDLPEFLEVSKVDGLAKRRIGHFRPWAWTSSAVNLGRRAHGVPIAKVWGFEPSQLPSSQKTGWRLNLAMRAQSSDSIDFCDGALPIWAEELSAVKGAIEDFARLGHSICLLKAPQAAFGSGHRRAGANFEWYDWAEQVIDEQGGLFVEPWLERVADFSVLYEAKRGEVPQHLGFTHLQNSTTGKYQASLVHPKWGTGFQPEVAKFLLGDKRALVHYADRIPQALSTALPEDYVGALAIDAFVYRQATGKLGLKAVCEVNCRTSMGRVAYELHRKFNPGVPGRLSLIPIRHIRSQGFKQFDSWVRVQCQPEFIEGRLTAGRVALVDPTQCSQLLPVWEILSD